MRAQRAEIISTGFSNHWGPRGACDEACRKANDGVLVVYVEINSDGNFEVAIDDEPPATPAYGKAWDDLVRTERTNYLILHEVDIGDLLGKQLQGGLNVFIGHVGVFPICFASPALRKASTLSSSTAGVTSMMGKKVNE